MATLVAACEKEFTEKRNSSSTANEPARPKAGEPYRPEVGTFWHFSLTDTRTNPFNLELRFVST